MTTGNLLVDKRGSLTTLSVWSSRYSSTATFTSGSMRGKQEFLHKTIVQGLCLITLGQCLTISQSVSNFLLYGSNNLWSVSNNLRFISIYLL